MSAAKQCTGCDGDGWLSHVGGRVDCDVCGGACATSDLVDEVASPGADAGTAFAQQAAQWEAELASRAETIASPDWKSLLVTSAELAAVAVASRATAATLRAIGGPVAETIAARADETARTASEGALMAVAESATRWVGLSTEPTQ